LLNSNALFATKENGTNNVFIQFSSAYHTYTRGNSFIGIPNNEKYIGLNAGRTKLTRNFVVSKLRIGLGFNKKWLKELNVEYHNFFLNTTLVNKFDKKPIVGYQFNINSISINVRVLEKRDSYKAIYASIGLLRYLGVANSKNNAETTIASSISNNYAPQLESYYGSLFFIATPKIELGTDINIIKKNSRALTLNLSLDLLMSNSLSYDIKDVRNSNVTVPSDSPFFKNFNIGLRYNI